MADTRPVGFLTHLEIARDDIMTLVYHASTPVPLDWLEVLRRIHRIETQLAAAASDAEGFLRLATAPEVDDDGRDDRQGDPGGDHDQEGDVLPF